MTDSPVTKTAEQIARDAHAVVMEALSGYGMLGSDEIRLRSLIVRDLSEAGLLVSDAPSDLSTEIALHSPVTICECDGVHEDGGCRESSSVCDFCTEQWPCLVDRLVYRLTAAGAGSPVPVQVDETLQDRVEDALAYYQCRETNPKADHPRMGYHAFSDEQRSHLKAKKAEAAAEIVRMFAAGSPAPVQAGIGSPFQFCTCSHWLEAHVDLVCSGERCTCEAFSPAVQVDETKLADVIGQRLSWASIHWQLSSREMHEAVAKSVAESLRGGAQ